LYHASFEIIKQAGLCMIIVVMAMLLDGKFLENNFRKYTEDKPLLLNANGLAYFYYEHCIN